MRTRLAGYSLLSFLSACFFFGVLHTVNAQTLPRIGTNPTPSTSPLTVSSPPTPTPKPTASPTPTLEPTSTPTPTPSPTPTATPTPTPIPIASPAELEAFFSKYSSEYNVDKELLKKIAKCESGFNSQADTGTYAGMYQFLAQTWSTVRNRMGLDPNPDLRKNAEESIRTAAYMLSQGQANAWPSCK